MPVSGTWDVSISRYRLRETQPCDASLRGLGPGKPDRERRSFRHLAHHAQVATHADGKIPADGQPESDSLLRARLRAHLGEWLEDAIHLRRRNSYPGVAHAH